MSKLSGDLATVLFNTIEAWDEFQRKQIGYFHDNGDQSVESRGMRGSLDGIGDSYSRLRSFLSKLERSRDTLAGINRQAVRIGLFSFFLDCSSKPQLARYTSLIRKQ